jgi:hypothetical protein
MSALKFKLDQDQMIADFFEDSWLAGISSTARDYQLCGQINQYLGFDFRVNNDLEVKLTTKRSFPYQFEYMESTSGVCHYIYNNHNRAGFLLPELKHVNYLWLVKGAYYESEEMKTLVEQCRKAPHVQMITLLNPLEIKSSMNLIF